MQPAFMDQPADHGAGDRLGHGPARGDTHRATPRRVALAQNALRGRDEHAIRAGRCGEECVKRPTESRGRYARRLHRITVRPRALRLGCGPVDRLWVEAEFLVWPEDDAAIA